MADKFDYIIVGSGSAGSVLAGRLSEGQKGKICVLEAGPPDRHPLIHIPAGAVYTLSNPKLNWMFHAEPCEGTGGRGIPLARGKTLGGSGSINGHIYNRGHRTDFDTWAQFGNKGWSYADVLPYFKRNEGRIGGGDDRYRGREGAFTITDIDKPDPLCEAFIEGAVSLGITRNPDYNGHTQEGIGYTQRSIHNGRRVSSARAYLYPAIKRGNVDVRTHAHVQKILFEAKRAVGIKYSRAGRTETVYARGEIILCTGSIGTPQLLQISGVGQPGLLGDIGVEVVHPLVGVGENLRDHYMARMTARVRGEETINEKIRGFGLVKEVVRYALTRKGALTLPPTNVYCFAKSNETLERGDMQVTFTPASYPDGAWAGLDKFPGVTIGGWQQRPESVGYIKARTSNAFDHPEIQPNYLAEEKDRQVLLAVMHMGRKILTSEAFKPFLEEFHWPEGEQQSDEELLEHARNTGISAFHLIGTCRMGPVHQTNTVVDNQLRVHGLQGLRVADASIMPTMPSANTNAATLMIGEKASDMILGKTPLERIEV